MPPFAPPLRCWFLDLFNGLAVVRMDAGPNDSDFNRRLGEDGDRNVEGEEVPEIGAVRFPLNNRWSCIGPPLTPL